MALHSALARVTPLASGARLRAALESAQEAAREGEAPGETLAFLGADRPQRARIRGATNASLLDRLRWVGVTLDARVQRTQRSVLAGIRPAAVVVFGVFVLLGFAAFMRYLTGVQREAMPW